MKPILIVIIAVVAAGAVWYLNGRPGSELIPPESEGVVCTADAKLCPDGSYVGRTGPDCEFAPCP